MKRTILLIVIVLMIASLFAQPYQSIFYKDTTKWISFECIIDINLYNLSSVYNDTIINSKEYKMIDEIQICDPNHHTKSGFIREDTLTGKVWFKPNFEAEYDKDEFLIMDLGLQVGDTFKFTTSTYLQKQIELLVDSIYYEDSRKIIQFEPYYNYCMSVLCFVEGVGPNNGISYSNESLERNALIFKYHNDQLVYTSDNYDIVGYYDNCGVGVDILKEQIFFNIQSVGDLEVDLLIHENQQLIQLTVYNINGKQVYSRTLSQGNNQICLNTHGIHIFKLQLGANITSFKLFL